MDLPDPRTAAVEAVRLACLDAGEPDPLDEAARLQLATHGATDAHLAHDGDEAVGFAWCHDGAVDLAVRPAARGRGHGRRLATEVSAPPGGLTAWSHGGHPAAARLARDLGWRRTRDLWVMRRPAALRLPVLALPDDVRIRGYRTEDPGDLASVLAVNAHAFADHPEQGGLTQGDLSRRMAEPWFEPAGLLLATDPTGEVLGFHWTKVAGPDTGEVYVVAVAPQAQGRGLGRLLTLAGLHHLVGRGVTEIELYVESDNRAAVAVYSGLGFTHDPHDTHVQYTRD